MKTLKLHYPMIQFLIISDIPQLGDIRSRDVFRPVARQRKDLMDYNWRLSVEKHYVIRHWIVSYPVDTVIYSLNLLANKKHRMLPVFTAPQH